MRRPRRDRTGRHRRASRERRGPGPGTGAPRSGWALTCGRTPAQVLVLVDGTVVGQTSTFTPRPDVDQALHASGPGGMDRDRRHPGPGPGAPRAAARRAHPAPQRPPDRPRGDREVRGPAPARARSPGRTCPRSPPVASQRLRSDQGRGLLADQLHRRHALPGRPGRAEHLPDAILADLLAPIAPRHGARRHGRSRPASPCRPDREDRPGSLPRPAERADHRYAGLRDHARCRRHALAWRIAGAGRGDPRCAPMLRTLARYRTARGLYRTWLAPRERYQCLDPGTDPDPTDIVIQMHVVSDAARFDPPAARTLCRAIGGRRPRTGVWVYYARTALVPTCAAPSCASSGCGLRFPAARLARPLPGQEPWSELVRTLVRRPTSRPSAPERRAVAALLDAPGPRRLRPRAPFAAVAVPQRPQRDRRPLLLVGGRGLRPLAAPVPRARAGRP